MFFRLCLTLFCFSLFGVEEVYLVTPNISLESLTGTNVGIRPCRKTGVRIESELIDDKIIIHNYGYGGSGLTLAFGGSKEVLEKVKETPFKTVAVLGGGVVGLSTAYDLLQAGFEVHLYSENWSPHLTSNVAAGAWTPLIMDCNPEKAAFHARLLKIAEERLLKSVAPQPEFKGVKKFNCYVLTAEPLRGGVEVCIHFDNGVSKVAQKLNRIGLDGKIFMEDLFAKVKKGATLTEKRFTHLNEVLALQEPVIINCLSLGSRELFHDNDFIPTRGQLIYFKAQPEIDYMLFQKDKGSNFFFHIYPWSDRLILGGIAEEGKEELVVDPDTIAKIFENGKRCLSGSQ